jgi:hypothetical protein
MTPTAEPTQQAQTKSPFLLTAFVLWILAFCGLFLVLLVRAFGEKVFDSSEHDGAERYRHF